MFSTLIKATVFSALSVPVITGCVCLTESVILRSRISSKGRKPVPYGDNLYGRHFSGTSLRVVMMGDSTAVGYGASSSIDTPGVLLANQLANVYRRPVRLLTVAQVGARSQDLKTQLPAVLAFKPHLVLIFIGANDIIHFVSPSTATAALTKVVTILTASSVKVVVGTCPDVSKVPDMAPPLRQLLGCYSFWLASSQRKAVRSSGGVAVSLKEIMHNFSTDRNFFSFDAYHPSSQGYQAAVVSILPYVLSLLPTPPSRAQLVKFSYE